MSHYLQKLLMTEEELEVASNPNTITYYSEQDDGRGKVLQPWGVLCSLREGSPQLLGSGLCTAELKVISKFKLHHLWVLPVLAFLEMYLHSTIETKRNRDGKLKSK